MTNHGPFRTVVVLLACTAWCGFAGAQEDAQEPSVPEEPAAETIDVDEFLEESPLVVVGPDSGGLPDYYALPWNRPLRLRVEYLHGWLNGNPLPALVTTAPAGDLPAIGMPTTTVLFGQSDVASSDRGGIRGTVGIQLGQWVDTDWAFEAQVLWLGDGQDAADFQATSQGDPVLARPFFDSDTGMQSARIVAAPDLPFSPSQPDLLLSDARLFVEGASDLLGVGGLFRRRWLTEENYAWDVLIGYRYLRFRESMVIDQTREFQNQAGTMFAGDFVRDDFSAVTEFNGVDLGIEGHFQRGPLRLELLMKLGIGNIHHSLDISGLTIEQPPAGDTQIDEFGFLAAASNIGRHTANQFGVVPELGVTLRRNITSQFAVTLGYTFIAMPSTLRVGAQVDTTASGTGGGTGPRPMQNESVLLLHGISAGVEW